jgi:hypothetical protein
MEGRSPAQLSSFYIYRMISLSTSFLYQVFSLLITPSHFAILKPSFLLLRLVTMPKFSDSADVKPSSSDLKKIDKMPQELVVYSYPVPRPVTGDVTDAYTRLSVAHKICEAQS